MKRKVNACIDCNTQMIFYQELHRNCELRQKIVEKRLKFDFKK